HDALFPPRLPAALLHSPGSPPIAGLLAGKGDHRGDQPTLPRSPGGAALAPRPRPGLSGWRRRGGASEARGLYLTLAPGDHRRSPSVLLGAATVESTWAAARRRNLAAAAA